MAYRLLLPSREALFPRQVEDALNQFDVYRTGDVIPTWSICDLAIEPSDSHAHRLTLRLLRDDAVDKEDDERHFMRPEGVRIWLELRSPGAADDRGSRLAARLCAMTIATKLRLPVLETRNGVFCGSPDAFTAWCSRTSHPDIMLLGDAEHMTLPKRRRGVARPPQVPGQAPTMGAAYLSLPKVGLLTRLYRKWKKQRVYIITLPDRTDEKIVSALIQEIVDTFGDQNVVYEKRYSRVLIVANDSAGTADVIGYYRRRAHPERLRLAAAMR